MIKFICVIYMMLPQPMGEQMQIIKLEKPFHSLQECRAWAHEQEYSPTIRSIGGTLFFCEKQWEV